MKSLQQKTIMTLLSVLLLFGIVLRFGQSLQAAAPIVDTLGYTFRNVLYKLNVAENGSVGVSIQADAFFTEEMPILSLEIPYLAGQSATLNSLRIGEIGPSGTASNYVGSEATALNPTSATIGQYQVTDNGRNLAVNVVTSIPEETAHRIIMDYTVFSASQRYVDVAEIRQIILGSQVHSAIEQLAVTVHFEAEQQPAERSQFRLFERNNLRTEERFTETYSRPNFLQRLSVPDETGTETPDNAWFFIAEKVPANAELELRVIVPSVWLPRATVTLANEGNQLERLIQEEDNYQLQKRRQFEYRDFINILIWILLALTVAVLLVMNRFKLFNNYRMARREVTDPPFGLTPGILAYVESRRLNSRVFLSTIFKLAHLGFIRIEGERIARVTESLLPDNKDAIRPYETAILHLLWYWMEGEEEVTLENLDEKLNQNPDKQQVYLMRIRNLLDAKAAAVGLIPLPSKRKPNYVPLLVGFAYLFLAIVLAWIGVYYRPLVLLLPAVLFFILSVYLSRFTHKGREVLAEAREYERYLSNIDHRVKESQELLAELDQDFIYSVALGCEKAFLTNLRYVVPIEDMISSGFLTRYGFGKSRQIVETYLDRKGPLGAKYLRLLITSMLKQIGKKHAWLSALLVKVRFIKPSLDPISDDGLEE